MYPLKLSLIRQMPKLAGKSLVTGCYHKHCPELIWFKLKALSKTVHCIVMKCMYTIIVVWIPIMIHCVSYWWSTILHWELLSTSFLLDCVKNGRWPLTVVTVYICVLEVLCKCYAYLCVYHHVCMPTCMDVCVHVCVLHVCVLCVQMCTCVYASVHLLAIILQKDDSFT